METVEQNLHFFRDLVICNRELYLWSYDSEMNLVDTNCPNIENFSLFFQIAGFRISFVLLMRIIANRGY